MKPLKLIWISAVALMSLGVIAYLEQPATACSFAAPDRHELDPTAIDTMPPAAPEVLFVGITRGNGCSGSDSCADLGIVTLELAPGSDDQAAPEQIGYRISVTAGEIPGEGVFPDHDFRLLDGRIYLIWADGATNQQEPMAATLELTALDLAGNESAPRAVDIADDGGSADCSGDPNDPNNPGDDPLDPDATDDGAGCAITENSSPVGLAVLALCMLWATRRRRAPGY